MTMGHEHRDGGSGGYAIMAMAHVLFLWVYLYINALSSGGEGRALPILVMFIAGTLALLLYGLLKGDLGIRLHLVLFALLVAWVSLRTIIDLGDAERLKQLTIGTAGGMVLFYIVGVCAGLWVNHRVRFDRGTAVLGVALAAFCAAAVWLLLQLVSRMRGDLFLVQDMEGGYQRAGNFLSMAFLLASFIHLIHHLQLLYGRRSVLARARAFLWKLLYLAAGLCLLFSAQLIGSNSATAVLAGTLLITIALSGAVGAAGARGSSDCAGDRSGTFGKLVLRIIWRGTVVLAAMAGLLALLLGWLEIDLAKTNLLSFGAGENVSLSSRIEILRRTGAAQLAHAPLVGDMATARVTTGSDGGYLHNLLPNTWANLGLVGLLIVCMIFALVLLQWYQEVQAAGVQSGRQAVEQSALGIYSLCIFLFLFLIANISVDFSWSVIWFAVGLLGRPILFTRQAAAETPANRRDNMRLRRGPHDRPRS